MLISANQYDLIGEPTVPFVTTVPVCSQNNPPLVVGSSSEENLQHQPTNIDITFAGQ